MKIMRWLGSRSVLASESVCEVHDEGSVGDIREMILKLYIFPLWLSYHLIISSLLANFESGYDVYLVQTGVVMLSEFLSWDI